MSLACITCRLHPGTESFHAGWKAAFEENEQSSSPYSRKAAVDALLELKALVGNAFEAQVLLLDGSRLRTNIGMASHSQANRERINIDKGALNAGVMPARSWRILGATLQAGCLSAIHATSPA